MKLYNLKMLRMKELQLTQEELAKQIGISRGHYRSVENGVHKASPRIVKRFCEEFTDNTPEMVEMVKRELFGLNEG